ncbi:MAG TPA: PhzF family phenazine biosynthesis protein [Chitinophagaceae bacterium]
MQLTIYQVDAFTNKLFHGNPAAIVPLEKWLSGEMMQQIAMENNLAETAFFVPSSKDDIDFEIRWFTPAIEINLCGHATLGSAWILYNKMSFQKEQLNFSCKSGKLSVEKRGDVLHMDFPSWKPERFNEYPEELLTAMGLREVVGVYKNRDVLIELQDEDAVKKCSPNFSLLKETGYKVIITAPGTDGVDFVSRFFAPSAGIDEDPVTGSAHSQLIPFWAEKLNKKKMFAKQLSQRGGEVECKWWGDRVTMSGQCVFYMKGEITIDNRQ